MATPTTNFVGTTMFNPASLGAGIYLAKGEKWGGGIGTGVTLTFSFPTLNSYWANFYGDGEPFNGFLATSAAEQSAIRSALNTWWRYTNVNFTETAEAHTPGGNVGELRFGYSSAVDSDAAAHAYYPASYPEAGDTWFSRVNFNRDGGGIAPGSYDFLTILHEVGHALGLKHSFDAPNAIPRHLDSYLYSIMSYSASPWSAVGDNFATFYPTTPMFYDLLAIQAMYGQRAFNAGDNVYNFNDGVRYWQAINDTGGTDRIVYNGVEAATINLNPGSFSALSEAIQFRAASGAMVSSKATVTIGPLSIIENAIGGSGSDTLTGNNYNNGLFGNNGNDVLVGNAGNDFLSGGLGVDTLRGGLGIDTLNGGGNSDYFRFDTTPNSTTNRDTVADYNPTLDTIQLENAIFTKIGLGGTLSVHFFKAATRAIDGNDYIVYDRNLGALYYDADGFSAGAAILIASFSNKPVLTASEFSVI